MGIVTRIKKFGNSAVVVLSKENLEFYNLKVGQFLDIEIKPVKSDRAGK